MNTRLTKTAFIEVYKKTFGNVSKSCDAVKISRSTYYEWIKSDGNFKSEIEEIEPSEVLADFAESKLIDRINEGDTTAIIFLLKTKAKHRGYIERQELDHNLNGSIPLDKWLSQE